ncbi:hypothetical protein LCDV1gp011 [Lymphocystis disease virus 1]|nr:hypothetical protein LCDV1gp011 [Lymphocystis disease virus 1]
MDISEQLTELPIVNLEDKNYMKLSMQLTETLI